MSTKKKKNIQKIWLTDQKNKAILSSTTKCGWLSNDILEGTAMKNRLLFYLICLLLSALSGSIAVIVTAILAGAIG